MTIPEAKAHIEEPLWAIRAGTSTDYDFVVDSWLHANRNAPMGGRFAGQNYKREHRRLIGIALRRSVLRVACVPGETTATLGWALYEEPARVVHYVYVREGMRRLGMASALMKSFGPGPATFTHKIADETFFRSKGAADPKDPATGTPAYGFPLPPAWQFNPYLFFTHMTEDQH